MSALTGFFTAVVSLLPEVALVRSMLERVFGPLGGPVDLLIGDLDPDDALAFASYLYDAGRDDAAAEVLLAVVASTASVPVLAPAPGVAVAA